MKNIISKSCMIITAGVLLASCKKFDEINVNPTAANSDQVQVEYFINNSITGAQQDPHVAERSFVLYWKTAARQHLTNTLAIGNFNDGWSSDYYGYVSGWLNAANTAIQVANEKVASGKVQPYTNNLLQIARIWRAYLMSELADNFGPIPVNAFQGVNPEFSDLKAVYYFMLDELKDASTKLDVSVVNPSGLNRLDPAFGFNYTNWRKYANSMRLRFAMRISEVDAAKAKTEFEAAAASGNLITAAGEIFQVTEQPGWNALTGVMSREWNSQIMSATLKNIYMNLGGIRSQDQLAASFHPSIKPANWIGLRLFNHFPTTTNDPHAGYWLDGIPFANDPRAYKTFILPGDFTNPNFCTYPSWDNSSRTTSRSLLGTDGRTINATSTWNGFTVGDWGAKGNNNQVRSYTGTMPRLSLQFRNSLSKRVFFGPWETYFLLAEAAVKGWATPMTGQAAYEEGVRASFSYWGVTSFAASYLTSQSYNNAGTSASWSHTTEPPASYTMNFEDGYTAAPGVATIPYPANTIYKNGTVKNDLLTKIITQKYISQMPWLPLEAWSDHRRLGLPFFENPIIENPLPNLPALTTGNMMTNQVKFYPQRIKYPSGLRNSNAKGYDQAVGFLAGPDELLTPLWWAKK